VQQVYLPLRGPVPTPTELGFRMPAEWELQESVWLVWPRDPLTWPGRVGKAREAIIKAIQAITSAQRVDLVVHPDLLAEAQGRLEYAGVKNVRFHAADHQDSWIRDYGPIYVTKGMPDRRERMAVKFQFNAWGNKYESLLKDRLVVSQLGDAVLAPLQEVAMVFEGGSLDVDGQGTALTTKQCLLNPNRNPDMSPQEIERHLEEYLNVQKVIWLGDGIQGDDTDGHVDDISRFVAPGLVVTATTEDRDHPNFQALDDNLHILKTTPDARGRPLRVVELPMPRDILDDEGKVLPASHANFLITNGVVLMPTFGGPSDAVAKARLQQCFKDRTVVGIDHRDLIWGMGGIHCLSQQMPAGKPADVQPA
jgi:agmatine deiminase